MRELGSVLLVGTGGFIGAVGRYLLSGWVHRLVPMATFPLGTLCVNLSGCFLIGLLGGLSESRQLFSPELRIFIFIGILGGFTTFSSFAHETLALARDAEFARALVNIGGQLIGGLVAAWVGYTLVRG
ncbi:fluoride efflux transporter CrcB [Candidatus Methylomirabilis sp.]|uniref:Fluoride-specific ion channel FluC n=1 Tax=Candidatus Methylomirabilis tolerans TaxID=3123416 RepID=A0AAJ1AMC3_9BACT|nr:fluoride efflux transporter CrcB [Candidatus Methylomirabilis sp.]